MRSVWRRWGHVLVTLLVLPLAFSSALPILARIAGGPAPHVCQCALHGHGTCACPVCNPGRDDLRLSEASLRGRCGEDDVAFGATLGSAVAAPAGFVVLAPDFNRAREPEARVDITPVFLTPPTPPPRTAFS